MSATAGSRRRVIHLPVDLVDQASAQWDEMLKSPEIAALCPSRSGAGAVRALVFLALRHGVPGLVGGR